MKAKRIPSWCPYLALHVTTTWYGWLPRFKHTPATYFKPRSRMDACLAPEGVRMSKPASHLFWGPVQLGVVWP
jgi:ADP-heptose:LPS heptosyltransferase